MRLSNIFNFSELKSTWRFAAFCRRFFRNTRPTKQKNKILVEFFNNSHLTLSLGFFSNVLADHLNASLVSFSSSKKNKTLFLIRYFKTAFVYWSFNCRGHLNVSRMNENQRDQHKVICHYFWSKVKSRSDLRNFKWNDFQIGEPIYESVLRALSVPTIDVLDTKQRNYIELCLKSFVIWLDYFKKNNITAVVLSHGIYQYGIICEIAKILDIPVYAAQPTLLYLQKPDNKLIAPDFESFPEIFKTLSRKEQEAGKKLAQAQLERRLSGEVGVDNIYQVGSAFNSKNSNIPVLIKSDRFKVLIAAHCFFDNPHAYGGLPFDDFSDWFETLGVLSEETDYDWYIKTHPEFLPGNIEVIHKFIKQYPKLRLVPATTSFHKLKKEGLNAVLTAYGTVGHELPLLGLTVVTSINNPHIAYDFNLHAKTKDEYCEIVKELPKIELKINPDKVYEYYYLYHYVRYVDDLVYPSFNDAVAQIGLNGINSYKAFDCFLDSLTDERAEIIKNRFTWFIESKRKQFFVHEYNSRNTSTKKITSDRLNDAFSEVLA